METNYLDNDVIAKNSSGLELLGIVSGYVFWVLLFVVCKTGLMFTTNMNMNMNLLIEYVAKKTFILFNSPQTTHL